MLPDTWERIHGEHFLEAARLHRGANLLKFNMGHHQCRMPRVVLGQPRVYAISAKILGATDGMPN